MCWEEEDWQIMEDNFTEEEWQSVFNKDPITQKKDDEEMAKLGEYTNAFCTLGETPRMTRIQMAPKLTKKDQYVYVRQDDWIIFMQSIESGKMYRLTDLVQLFNTKMKPFKKITNRSFAHIKFVKSSFKIKRFNEKGRFIRYYIKI